MQNLFDEIRSACQQVARQAKHVHVNEEEAGYFIRGMHFQKTKSPLIDRDAHYIESPADTVAFFLTLDSINFGSGYFPHLSKLPGKSGYFTIATRLTEYFRAHGPMSATQLTELNAASCLAIFKQSQDDGPIDELMSLFARALNDLGKLLLKDFAGSFVALVKSADHRAQNLVRILDRMPMFRDVENYHDLKVPFYKRAQLTAADLHMALPEHELGRFDDLDDLTIFADNLVPHVLRVDEVLQYEPDLAERIERGDLIESGSDEEIEIRACAIYATELIKTKSHLDLPKFTSMELDYLIWNLGRNERYKSRPRHRTRTWFY